MQLLQDINRAVGGAAERRLVARVELHQSTPLWTGGPDGETFRVHEGLRLEPLPPSPYQFIGRARWLLRSLIAGSTLQAPPGCRPVTTHQEADQLASKVFGDTTMAGLVSLRIHYEEETSHSVKPRYLDPHLAAGLLEYIDSHRSASKLFEQLEAHAYAELRGLMKGTREAPLAGVGGLEERVADCVADALIYNDPEALLLFTIPRVYMVLRSAKDSRELLARQPIRQGYYTVTLEVYARPGASRVEGREWLLAAGAAALAATPALLGVGKATARGLGRFTLESFSVNHALLGNAAHDLEEALTLLQHATHGHGLPHTLKQAIGKLSYIAMRAAGADCSQPVPDEELGLPSLARAGVLYSPDPPHPCPYATRELTRLDSHRAGECRQLEWRCSRISDSRLRTLCLLSAIGKATLKSTWKIHACMDVRAPGRCLHTWPLGLPRTTDPSRTTSRTSRTSFIPTGYVGFSLRTYDFVALRHESPLLLATLAGQNVVGLSLRPIMSLSSIVGNSNRDITLFHVGWHRRGREPIPVSKLICCWDAYCQREFEDLICLARAEARPRCGSVSDAVSWTVDFAYGVVRYMLGMGPG